MKILANIPALLTLLKDVNKYKNHAIKIDQAKAAGDVEEERKWILDATSTFGPMVMDQFGIELHVHGEENIPDEGPAVIISNHQSYADIPVLFAVFRKFQFGFVGKQDLAKAPYIKDWLPRIRSVFIKNDDPRESLKTINEGAEYVKQGFSLAIFPEGHRSKSSEMLAFMKGSLKLATKPKAPIIPVALNGTYKVIEKTGVIRGARVDVTIFPPIETEGLTKKEEKELNDKIEAMIRAEVAELIKLQA